MKIIVRVFTKDKPGKKSKKAYNEKWIEILKYCTLKKHRVQVKMLVKRQTNYNNYNTSKIRRRASSGNG